MSLFYQLNWRRPLIKNNDKSILTLKAIIVSGFMARKNPMVDAIPLPPHSFR
jgi:hypothetical protein